jgi:hypothetical protein
VLCQEDVTACFGLASDADVSLSETPLGLIVDAWLDRLPPGDLVLLSETLQQEIDTEVGTMCSGTEIIKHIYDVLEECWLRKLGVTYSHISRFACESDAAAQSFLCSQHGSRLGAIFCNNSEILKNRARDLNTATVADVLFIKRLIAGFTCISLAATNKNRASAKGCVQKGEDATGVSFAEILDAAKKFTPAEIILENVKGLGAKVEGSDLTDADYVIKMLEDELHVHAEWYTLDATDFGAKTKRTRIYCVGWRAMDGREKMRAQSRCDSLL